MELTSATANQLDELNGYYGMVGRRFTEADGVVVFESAFEALYYVYVGDVIGLLADMATFDVVDGSESLIDNMVMNVERIYVSKGKKYFVID